MVSLVFGTTLEFGFRVKELNIADPVFLGLGKAYDPISKGALDCFFNAA